MSYTAESILASWQEDAEIDPIELGDAGRNNPKLHAKYLEIFFMEKMRLLRLQDQQKRMRKIRFEYWDGKLSQEELKLRGWEPQPLKLLRTDLPMYMEADEVLADLTLRVGMQAEKVNILDMILKHIVNRGFAVKAAIDFERFRAGG